MLILVTGCSKGIGFEIVKKLATSPDHQILAVSRNTVSLSELIKKNRLKNVKAIKADITRVSGRQRILNSVKSVGLPLNVLINNAGMLVNKEFEKISAKEIQAVYETNVFAPFHLMQDLVSKADKKNRTHFVNISSMGGFQGSAKFAGLSAYSSSKAAIACLSECLAEELKTKNISVNCLAIGAVQTEMLSKAFPGYKAPLTAKEMADFICDFSLNGHKYFNGKILPVSLSTP